MEIANQDMAARILQAQICAINNDLRDSFESLQCTSSQNKYLQQVVNDYTQHYEEEKDEKKAQYEALQLLSDYIDIIGNGHYANEYFTQEVKQDQHNIIKEMVRLKRELQK